MIRHALARPLGRRHRGLTLLATLVVPPSLSHLGGEKIGLCGELEKALDHLLGLGAERHDPAVTAPAVLVVGRLVKSNLTTHVDIAGAHDDRLAGPHSREPLQPDHGRDFGRDRRQYRLDPGPRDRLDRLGFAGCGTTEP